MSHGGWYSDTTGTLGVWVNLCHPPVALCTQVSHTYLNLILSFSVQKEEAKNCSPLWGSNLSVNTDVQPTGNLEMVSGASS